MHYLTLITAQIPSLEEDVQGNEAVAEQIAKLEREKKLLSDQSPCILNLFLEACNSIRDTFSRAVASSASNILEPYSCDTENPDYLEFWDKTEELETAYQQMQDCVRLPEGRIVSVNHPRIFNHFTLRNEQVYELHAGPLQHEKRTKAAKRIKALPNYPINKLYSTLSDYASEYWGFSYYPEQKAYGFYYNPNAFFDWYSIGGRWTDLFLVKENCPEYSIGEKSWTHYDEEIPCPEGYKWVCAARKKDIEWQMINNWYLLNAKNRFCSLEKLFLTGERDEHIYGTVTEDGIEFLNKLIYVKGETLGSYLSRLRFDETARYPVPFYGFLSEDGWQTQNDFVISDNNITNNQETLQKTLEQYIDSLSDDTVLIGIDCHM